MTVTYYVSADSAMRAVDIARSRAMAEGWSSVTVVRTDTLGPRDYEVHCLVSGH